MKIWKWHFEFSKIIVIFCACLFIWVLKSVFVLYRDGVTVSYLAMYSIPSTATLCATAFGFYFNKAKTYNNIHAQHENLQWEYEFKLAHQDVFGKPAVNEYTNQIDMLNKAFKDKINEDIINSISEIVANEKVNEITNEIANVKANEKTNEKANVIANVKENVKENDKENDKTNE